MPHTPTVPEPIEIKEDGVFWRKQIVEKLNEVIDYLSTQEENGIENFLSSRMVVEKPEEFSYQNPSSSRGQEYDTQEKGWELGFDKSFYKFQVYTPSDNYDIQTGANDIKDFIKKTLTTEREKVRERIINLKEESNSGVYLVNLRDVIDLLDHTE